MSKHTAVQKIEKLSQKLDFWEKNLRSNFRHYEAEGRDPAHYADKIHAELGIIDAVRDILTDAS